MLLRRLVVRACASLPHVTAPNASAPTCLRSLLTDTAASSHSHYQVLGVDRSASVADVKRAFRQRAKALHPDLNQGLSDADAQASFLRLVEAYEVLSDTQQRRLYDAATDTQLPGVLRRAAAAQQAAAAAAAQQQDSQNGGGSGQEGGFGIHTDPADADALNWRWGLGDWARNGPSPTAVQDATIAAAAGGDSGADSGALRLSVLSALRRHRTDLEAELHAALMTAFLGPRLELMPGELLPPAFELDERSHPLLTDDLLHLVHGRTLLGVVQLPTTLKLQGGDSSSIPQLEGSSSTSLQLPTPDSSSTTTTISSSSSSHIPDPSLDQPQPCTETVCQEHCDPQEPQHSQHTQGQPQVQHPQQPQPATEAPHTTLLPKGSPPQQAAASSSTYQQQQQQDSRDPDAEIGDEEWRQLLQEQHPLRGVYEWLRPPAASSDAAGSGGASGEERAAGAGCEAVDAASSADSLPGDVSSSSSSSQDAALPCSDVQQPHSQQEQQQQQQPNDQPQVERKHSGAVPIHPAAEGGLGGRAARQAWQRKCDDLLSAAQQLQQQAAVAQPATLGLDPAASAPMSFLELMPQGVSAAGEQQQQQQGEAEWAGHTQSWQQQWNQLDPLQQVQLQQQWWQRWQEQRQQQEDERQQQHQQQERNWQQTEQQRERQQQQKPKPRSGHRRLWRWLKTPTPDWLAADWSFTDEDEGVLVLRLLQEGGAVSAVAVRDDRQDNKPIKIWVDGVLFAAVLDDIVMQPLTGKMMAVLYRVYTPGVHHVYFYLPNTQGSSRVVARLQRRWMPPSSTWLWPARAASHDGCSWVLEWEGWRAQKKPGWLHPSVFVLTAAYYSFDMERRRLSRADGGRLRNWWDGLVQKLQAVMGG